MHKTFNNILTNEIFTCPDHNFMHNSFHIFMHKIFYNMLTDELKFREEEKKKKEGRDDVGPLNAAEFKRRSTVDQLLYITTESARK